MAAVPSIGRADRAVPREADLTRALYEQYATQIFRYCLHQLGSREEAEDAVQSTFLNAFRGIKRGIVPEQESAWLFTIAHNVCLSRRRSTWRRGRIESPTDFDVVEELTPAPSRLADELLGLQDVLEQMPESQRRAILLREWQGLSYREIAEELELSQTAVETLIFRARRSLAKGLEAPPEPARKRRMVRGADLGNVLAGLKSLFIGGGAAAAKVAAVVAVVGTGTVVATTPASHRHVRTHAVPPVPAPVAPTPPVTSAGTHRLPPPQAPAAPAPAAPAPAIVQAAADPPPPPAASTNEPAAPPSSPSPAPVAPPPTPTVVPDPPGPPSDPGDQGQGNGNGQGSGQDHGNGQGNDTPGQGNQGQGGGQGQGNAGGQGQGESPGHGH